MHGILLARREIGRRVDGEGGARDRDLGGIGDGDHNITGVVDGMDRDVAGADGDRLIEGGDKICARRNIGCAVGGVEAGGDRRSHIRSGRGFEQIDHGAAEGVANQHVGPGAPVVVAVRGSALAERMGIDRLHIAGKLRIFPGFSVHGKHARRGSPYRLPDRVVQRRLTERGEDEGRVGHDLAGVAVGVIAAQRSDQLDEVLLRSGWRDPWS